MLLVHCFSGTRPGIWALALACHSYQLKAQLSYAWLFLIYYVRVFPYPSNR